MNNRIRTSIYANGLRHWEVADALGINEATLSRKLRHELPEDEEQRILEVIENLRRERDA